MANGGPLDSSGGIQTNKIGGSYFVISGLTEIKRALKTLGPKLGKKVVRQSIRTGLKPLLAEVKRNAPVGTRTASAGSQYKPGQLKANIKLRKSMSAKREYISLEIRVGSQNFVGKTYYGAMVEFGTKKMSARKFMQDPFDRGGQQAAERIMALITQGIEDELKAK